MQNLTISHSPIGFPEPKKEEKKVLPPVYEEGQHDNTGTGVNTGIGVTVQEIHDRIKHIESGLTYQDGPNLYWQKGELASLRWVIGGKR